MEVLYADAADDARASVSAAFSSAGHDVEAVASAAAARDALASGEADCLVCEHDLPDGDARSLLATAGEAAPATDVVVYTAAGDESLAGEVLAAGADGYVPKDDGVAVLRERVEALDGRRRVERLEALQTTARAMMRAETPEEVAEAVVDAADAVLGQPSASVRLYDAEADALRAVAVTERVRETTGAAAELPPVGPGEGAFWRVYETGERALVETPAEAAAAYADGSLEASDGFLIEPLGEHGVLAFSTWDIDALDAPDAHMARLLATTATAALDNAARKRDLERYETIVSAAGDGVFATDADGRFTHVNERFAELTGYDRADLVGTDAGALHEDGDKERVSEHVRRLIDGEADVMTVEVELLRAGGASVPLELSLSLRPGEAFTGAVGTARAIERRKRVERELRERKRKTEHLHGISSRLQECEAVEDICRVAVEAARGILDLADCSVRLVDGEELVLQHASEPGKLRERMPIEGTVAGGAFRRGEARVVADVRDLDLAAEANPHGYRSVLAVPLGEHGVLMAARMEPDAYDQEDAELAELLAAHVTHALDRVGFEAELRAERDRLAALFDNVPDPVVSVRHTEEGGIVESVNPAFETVFGFDAGTIAGESLGEYIVPPEDRDRSRKINEPATEGEVVETEVRRRTADGLRDFELTIVPVDDDGDAPATFGVYSDVTERKQRRRRVEVLNRVLRHDLRNGMNIVRGAAELLADRVDDAAALEHVETIVERTDDLLGLADRTRAVERTLDREDGAEEPIDLAASLRESAATLRSEHPDAELSLACPDRAVVDGGDLLELAIHDLVENAVVHNDRQRPTVDVELSAPSAGMVTLRVADDGPGIPAEERQLLTGDQEITQLRHASGLGLWLANWAVTHAGGDLAFEDNDPRGSVVRIRLPTATGSPVPSAPEPE